jgi:hypothetical protein
VKNTVDPGMARLQGTLVRGASITCGNIDVSVQRTAHRWVLMRSIPDVAVKKQLHKREEKEEQQERSDQVSCRSRSSASDTPRSPIPALALLRSFDVLSVSPVFKKAKSQEIPMPRRVPQPPSQPEFPHEKTHSVLKKQLAALDGLRRRNYQDAENDEREWKNLTHNIFIRGFGSDSNNLKQYYRARDAGEYYMGEMHPSLMQRNFDERIEAFTGLLRSTLAELELLMPEPEVVGSYEPGDDYQFYRDLKTIVGFATTALFIIDNYLDNQIFDIYIESVPPSVSIRVMTEQVSNSLRTVAEKFAKRGNFELRSSKDVHDRVVFADDRCWLIGQSIKDAARKKPTYIIEHSSAGVMRGMYEPIWNAASVVVMS